MSDHREKRRQSTTKGFKSASGLLQSRIRDASASRGFAETRLLTHWSEIVGPETAQHTTPVKVGYGRGAIGATLTVLTTGASAPLVEMQKEQIRERVNTCYGYTAISRIVITQTAPTGFSEGQIQFAAAPKQARTIPAKVKEDAAHLAADVTDENLKHALETLAGNVLSKTQR